MSQPDLPATAFAPQLYIKRGVRDVRFYEEAFGAKLLRSWKNEDGSLHIAELSVNGALFYLHEETPEKNCFCPESKCGTTAIIGLFVPEVDLVMRTAAAAGATLISAAQDYDYGLRQGKLKDPLGHVWLIQSRL